MSIFYWRISPRDSLVSRDGRPFGAGQGNRMRGLPWLLPSVVAGAFRTALVKADSDLDFSGNMPEELMKTSVAGMLPVAKNGDKQEQEIYLPAPCDSVWNEKSGKILKVQPRAFSEGEGVDFPAGEQSLLPVMLSEKQSESEFKPRDVPAWWPASKFAQWLTEDKTELDKNWFDNSFLKTAIQEMRDHVCIDPERGAAAESLLFATANLNTTFFPRFGETGADKTVSFERRFAEASLALRTEVDDPKFNVQNFNGWHPIGGERRMVHWEADDTETNKLWKCLDQVKIALTNATHVRMVLTTPAIFQNGWKPDWLDENLEGTPPGTNVKLKLVGICNQRWKAISGWSLAPPRGPKPVRRMVPAGGVYFFEVDEESDRDTTDLADAWLQPVSDSEQDRRDGFGLAIWGTWKPEKSELT